MSTSLRGLSQAVGAPYDPETDSGLVNVGGTWIDPHDEGYTQALVSQANARNFGTPNYLGGVGGVNAMNIAAIPQAMNDLEATTGKNYKLARNTFAGLQTASTQNG